MEEASVKVCVDSGFRDRAKHLRFVGIEISSMLPPESLMICMNWSDQVFGKGYVSITGSSDFTGVIHRCSQCLILSDGTL